MKKVLVLLAVLLVASTAFAAVIQVGPTATYRGDLTDVEQLKDFSNYSLGADARFNLGMVDLAAAGTINTDFSSQFTADTFVSLNARLTLSIFEMSFGAGTDLCIGNNFEGKEGTWCVNGEELSSFFDVLKASQFDARIAAGVNLGGVGLNLAYRIPFETLGELIQGGYQDVANFNKGVASVSLLLNIF